MNGFSPDASDQRMVALARIVFDLTQRLDGLRGAEEVFNAVVDGLETLVPFERAALVLTRNDGQDVEHWYARGVEFTFREHDVPSMVRLERLIDIAEPLIYDIRETPRYMGDRDRYANGFRQAAAVPIILDDRRVGFLTLLTRTPNAWNESDLWIMSSVAGALGTMLAATNFRSEAEERRREAEFLAELGYLLSSLQDIDELLTQTATHIAARLGATTAIYTVVEDRLSVTASVDPRPNGHHQAFIRMIAESLVARPHGPVQRAIRTDRDADVLVLHRGDAPDDPVLGDLFGTLGAEQLIVAPVIWRGTIIAALLLVPLATIEVPEPIAPARLPGILERAMTYLAPALQGAHVQIELARALNESEVLRRILGDTATIDDPIEALDIVVRAAQMLFGADYVAIGQRASRDDMAIHWIRSVGAGQADTNGEIPSSALDEGWLSFMEEMRPLALNDRLQASMFGPGSLPIHELHDLRASLTTPFEVAGGWRGILFLGFRHSREFDPADIRFARSLANGVASTLYRATNA